MLLFLISKDHRGCTGIYLYVGSEVVIIRGDNSIRLCRQWYGYGPGFCSSRKISDILYAFVLTAEPISSCHCHFYNVTQTDNSEVLEEWTPLFVYLVLVVGVTEWVMHLCLLQLSEISRDSISRYSCWQWPGCQKKGSQQDLLILLNILWPLILLSL